MTAEIREVERDDALGVAGEVFHVNGERRLQINPEPLRVVTDEEHAQWWRNFRPQGPEASRRVWVALGGDPDVWDAEHIQE